MSSLSFLKKIDLYTSFLLIPQVLFKKLQEYITSWGMFQRSIWYGICPLDSEIYLGKRRQVYIKNKNIELDYKTA